MRIRALQAGSNREIELIASRMRLTLVEVLGKDRAEDLYSMDWLRERVRFHLDPMQCHAAVYLAEAEDGHILGQSIVRIEPARPLDAKPSPEEYGLMSTIYVAPEARRAGVAVRLVDQVEAWIQEQGVDRAATNTGQHNLKVIRLFEKRGYTISDRTDEMVQLSRELAKT